MNFSKKFGMFLAILAGIIFYLCFFVLAPYVASTIPEGSWHLFLTFVVYGVIAYFGGIAIPLILLITGVALLLK